MGRTWGGQKVLQRPPGVTHKGGEARGCRYLNGVLKLGVLVVEDAEAEGLLWDHFHQHEVAALEGRAERGRQARKRMEAAPQSSPGTSIRTYQDVSFVRKRVVSLLGDEKQLVKEEERPLILGPLEAEGPLEN